MATFFHFSRSKKLNGTFLSMGLDPLLAPLLPLAVPILLPVFLLHHCLSSSYFLYGKIQDCREDLPSLNLCLPLVEDSPEACHTLAGPSSPDSLVSLCLYTSALCCMLNNVFLTFLFLLSDFPFLMPISLDPVEALAHSLSGTPGGSRE